MTRLHENTPPGQQDQYETRRENLPDGNPLHDIYLHEQRLIPCMTAFISYDASKQDHSRSSYTNSDGSNQSEQDTAEYCSTADGYDSQSELETVEHTDTAEEDDCQTSPEPSDQESPEHFVQTTRRPFSSLEQDGPPSTKRVRLNDQHCIECFEPAHLFHQGPDAINELKKCMQRPTLDMVRFSIKFYGLSREKTSHSMLEDLRKKAKVPRTRLRDLNLIIPQINEWILQGERLNAALSGMGKSCHPLGQVNITKTTCWTDQDDQESLELLHVIHQAQDAIIELENEVQRTMDTVQNEPAREKALHSTLNGPEKIPLVWRRHLLDLNHRISKIKKWLRRAERLGT